MKERKHVIRLVILIAIGFELVYQTTRFKYNSFIFDLIIYGVFILIAFFFLCWVLSKDLKSFKSEKSKKYLASSIIGITFIILIVCINWRISYDFNKPTLLKAYYDGDINGASIDFKEDRTYIFENSAIGISHYEYGTYSLRDNSITLDKKGIDNVINSDRLIIQTIETDCFIKQVNELGKIIENETEFKVTVDNRKK